jgi:thiol-disulfide isomerase/thioredoxin
MSNTQTVSIDSNNSNNILKDIVDCELLQKLNTDSNDSNNPINIIKDIVDCELLQKLIDDNDSNYILWFSASWCGPCRDADKCFGKIAESYKMKSKPLNVYKIDIDTVDMENFGPLPDCTIKLLKNVEKLPTMCHYKDGSEQPNSRIIGSNIDNILKLIKSIDEINSAKLCELDDF